MIPFIIKWNRKRKIRLLIKEIRSLLIRDDDILSEERKGILKGTIEDLKGFISISDGFKNSKEFNDSLSLYLNRFHQALPPKKYKIFREYVEILVVAITVAFGVRALFLQPFKIPTGSMQPTLFGIHYIEKGYVPNLFQPLNFLLFSTQRAKLTVERSGYFNGFYPPESRFSFPYTAFDIGGVKYALPGSRIDVWSYCFRNGYRRKFYYNEKVCDGWLSQGDHLFVDRFSFRFIPLKRGDIVVFTTEGIIDDATGEPLSKHGLYYVKRLVGMPGDRLKIVDGMLYIKTKGSKKYRKIVDIGVPVFKKIYSNKGGYQGYGAVGRLASGSEVVVPKNSYFVLGDNTLVSADSRYWGFVPRRNMVGRALFVFWPFSRRWGLVDRTPPLDVKTEIIPYKYIPAMSMQ